MKGARILVVDDDPAILRIVRRSLEFAGYNVEALDCGDRVTERVETFGPDVILLDLVLPDADGIELTRKLNRGSASIIVVSAVGDDRKKVEALDSGADDYLTKPFSIDELLARIRVALRHQARSDSEPLLEAGPIQLDLASREVTVEGEAVRLTPKEFELLRQLAFNAGRVLTQRMLLASVWGAEYIDDAHILRTFIYQLRRKIEAVGPGLGAMIVTDPGVGYRLVIAKP
ncbi:MAG: response regulator transcription factor [Tepidiformaceae bacterium]